MTQINDRPMRERIARQLGNNRYECAICYQKILYRQAIWSCRTCFHIFHISNRCIVGWAKSSRQNQPDGKWSCPTCQTRYDRIPYNYYCFCGKERNPQTHRGDTPHSCGNPCGLKRSADCPHRCNERCHPGPCPECPVMTTKRCNCGNIVKAIRCGSGDNVKCDKICDKTLECGVHKCAQVCHVENCQPCSVMIVQECYCGKHTREVVCSENYMNPKYSCGEECGRLYNCKLHHCNNKCHPSIGAGNENADPDASGCGECPTSLNRIKHCPCGSKTLADLGVERKSCEDPIPTCNNICNRVLPCGGAETHRCPQKCHTGPCPPCTKKTNVVCRCRSMSDTLPCAEYLKLEQDGGQVLCAKRCKKKKSCGLHKCQEVCCIQEEHFCLQMCNKRLSCGNHNCDMVCHPGQCPRCLNASFDEQFCHCGRTVAPPPVPCGAPPPDCHFPCSRHHPCGHPVTHKCHSDPTCPPCTYLTDKSCYGGHEARRPIPCNLAGFSCGRQCLLPLSCGIHFCNRNCHNGLCVQPNEKCTRPCPVIRSNCEHPCAAPCHGTEKCPNEPCKHPVEVTCECGRKKQMFKCHEVEATFAKNHTALVNEQIEEMQKKTVEQGPLPLRKSPSWEKLNFMTCDDDCKKLARNKKVAEALGLTTNSEGTLVDSENCTITYTDYLRSVLKQHPQFVTKLEEEFQKMIDVFADVSFFPNIRVSRNFKITFHKF
ncbi:hypothetical protein WR25_20095 isoform C [Diploscapter pachys]|uniref:RING-type domain-containing protein n=1 Tax=Diploscapter pachys TaxID=2018661 RepID=A0A2A2L2A9_9BILA|nr:hypothetical protein WR25_20095 isoform A [Diploscapter pachys]PAV80218.1 hypothetical protein WR25_20095 isoform B [Diploscapter pachys]PAV80219.1 hypothetical protein WR25_20095 isoform C [Diploscapter pachys]